MKLLDTLQKKSRAEKQSIVFVVSGGVTGVIFLVWAVAFFTSLDRFERRGVESTASSFDSFINSFQEGRAVLEENVHTVREQIGQAREAAESLQAFELPEEDTSAIGVSEAEEVPLTEVGDGVFYGDVSVDEETPTVPTKEEKPQREVTDSGVEIIRLGE